MKYFTGKVTLPAGKLKESRDLTLTNRKFWLEPRRASLRRINKIVGFGLGLLDCHRLSLSFRFRSIKNSR